MYTILHWLHKAKIRISYCKHHEACENQLNSNRQGREISCTSHPVEHLSKNLGPSGQAHHPQGDFFCGDLFCLVSQRVVLSLICM